MTSNHHFSIGDTITTQSGMSVEIIRFIGEGGQGQVYEVQSNENRWALKYYTKEYFATAEQMENLKELIRIGSPSPTFLWPVDIVKKSQDSLFGYIMPLRPPHFENLIDYVKRRTNPTFYSIITAAFYLADSFSKLHAQGLCYRDISLGNVFFEPITGDVLICDNDNVCYNNDNSIIRIGGTSGFIAPEIVLGNGVPNRNTDLYSLSVLIFHLLLISHPLNGIKESQIDCWDPESEKKIYGSEALFIFDPVNDSNRPDQFLHQNAILFWNIYPDLIKKIFIRAFTKGLFDPDNGRVRENEWKYTLIQLRDSLIYCTNCESQVFYDPLTIQHTSVSMNSCWHCKSPIIVPPRIKIGKDRIVMLNTNTVLYTHHLNPINFDITTPLARVSKHPNMNFYGLQNLTTTNWTVSSPDGKTADVPPNKNVPIKNGIIIDFGSVKGEIQTDF